MKTASFLIQENIPLSKYCTFGIGGAAKYFTEAKSIEDMQRILWWAHENNERYFILGKGSNTLFHDKGYNGLVILNKIDFLEMPSPGFFHVGSGYSFSRLGTLTARQGWTGLEFASGIPGTVGGAVFMNAGANGQETCDTIISVDFISSSGEFQQFESGFLNFSYRRSVFQEISGAIVGASFQLEPEENARKKQCEIISYRTSTQPYGDKSAGCLFRNPEGNHAGALIEKCDLKGVHVGGAQVSTKHANFIINTGEGKAEDVLSLIEIIKEKVKKQTGYDLKSEVRVIPYE